MTSDCGFDVSECVMGCGNGVLEPGEECDGTDFGSASCENLGYGSGTLSCSPYCTLDMSLCEQTPESCGNGVVDASEVCDGTSVELGALLGQCHECTWAEYYYDWGMEGLSPETHTEMASMEDDGTLLVVTKNSNGSYVTVFDRDFNKGLDVALDMDQIPHGLIRWSDLHDGHLLILQEEMAGMAPYTHSWAIVTLYSIDTNTGTLDASAVILDEFHKVCGAFYNSFHVSAYREGDSLYLTYLSDHNYACGYNVSYMHRELLKFDLASMTTVYRDPYFSIDLSGSLNWGIIGIKEDSVVLLGPTGNDKQQIQVCTVSEDATSPPVCSTTTTRYWLSQSHEIDKMVIKYFNDYGQLMAAFTLKDGSEPVIDVYDLNMSYYGSIAPFRDLPGSGRTQIDDILLKDGMLYLSATVDGDLGGTSFGGSDIMLFRFSWPDLDRQTALRFGTAGDDGSTKIFSTAHGTAVLGHGTGFFTGSHYLYVDHPFLWLSTK